MPLAILLSLLSKISNGVNALLTMSDICPDIKSLIVPSICDCKSVILLVRVSKLVVSSLMVFVFCKILIGDAGKRPFNSLIFLVIGEAAPIGFNPVANEIKSEVNSIGKVANFVSVSLMSLPIFSNFERTSLSTVAGCSVNALSNFCTATLSAAPAGDKL